ncbi:Uncharacterized protein Fot_34139 [Forsythia ovata]|uniref:Uncharacterized protein n=1 Tax=Forsythia ovata TaxID=205694 RepID=A0ABD1SI03_9LAMI
MRDTIQISKNLSLAKSGQGGKKRESLGRSSGIEAHSSWPSSNKKGNTQAARMAILDDQKRERQSLAARARRPCQGEAWRAQRIFGGLGKVGMIFFWGQGSRTSIPPPPGKLKYINIGSRHDELDPTALGKLPALAAIAATSVHKYWTSAFGKAAENVELTELLKLAEMYTSRSQVLNCELYKVLAMKVDELRPMVGEDKDVDMLRLENKDDREQLAFSEDARARAIYDITKAKMI